MRRSALLALLLVGCSAASETPRPFFWSLEDLVRFAVSKEKAYVPHPTDSARDVPMSAVITPPGEPVFFASPPFAPEQTRNTQAGPQLNLLPGLAGGRYVPYVTIELWGNDFGDVWVQPIYSFVTRDGEALTPIVDLRPVLSVDAHHRFYSPFWRVYRVVVPDGRVDALRASPPKSVKAVLDLGFEIQKGPLVLCPIVPEDTTIDPALAEVAPGEERPLVPGLIGDTLRAEYEPEQLAKIRQLTVTPDYGWAEGKSVAVLGGFGLENFRELPGEVVEGIPIFMWVDVDAEGNRLPLGLPNVGGHGPLFSNRPLVESGTLPNWSSFWDVVQVQRPRGAQPFFPGPDLADLRARLNAPEPSEEVAALPHVMRYAGRLATNPACFTDTGTGVTTEWAETCGFLDSQEKVEARVAHDQFFETGLRVLCPIVLWAPVRP